MAEENSVGDHREQYKVEHWSSTEEGQFFERKSALQRPLGGKPKPRKATDIMWDIAETICAFANADGGELVIGIENDGDVTGIPHPDDKREHMRSVPRDRNYIQPPVHATVTEISRADGTILLHFETDSSPEVHHLSNGRYVMRSQDRNIPYPADQIAALKATKGQGLIERSFPLGASVNDINLDLVESLQSQLGVEGSPEAVLLELRLAVRRSDRIVPNLAGLLMFGNDPLFWHPSCGIDFVRWEGTTRRSGTNLNILHRKRIEAPLAALIQQAIDSIQPYIRQRQRLQDLFFAESLEYPSYVWQEAIVNAVGHRDYSNHGTAIEFWMFDDRIEVRSPGYLPGPATIAAINRREALHVSRNPLIVRTLASLGYMRELGEGIPRMFSIMEREGFYPPRFDEVGGIYFQVTLRNEPIYDAATLDWLRRFAVHELTADQKRLLAYARMHEMRFTNRDLQKLAEMDLYSASNSIKTLIRKGVARSLAKGSRVYEVVEPVDDSIPLPSSLVALLPVLYSQGEISNADIRNVLDVTRSVATGLATELWQAGWLTRSGQGKWTRYRLAESETIQAQLTRWLS